VRYDLQKQLPINLSNQWLVYVFSRHFSFYLWLLIDAPQMGVNQIDRRDLDFDRGARRKIRQ